MSDSFVSKKDRIIASAIELICDSGLSALNSRNLAAKENMPEELLYRYYGGMDEVLSEVVENYLRFDKGIRQTIRSKQCSNVDRIKSYFEAYATNYDNDYAMSTLMLHYEELLHREATREKIAHCISERVGFLELLFADAIKAGEITSLLSANELAKSMTGSLMAFTLGRRIRSFESTFKEEFMSYLEHLFAVLVRAAD